MDMRRLYLVVLMLVMVCRQVGPAQNNPPAKGNGAPAKEELDPQLKVYRGALLKGDIDAAELLLFHQDPNARRILLDVLNQKESSPARMVVCRVLIKSKDDNKAVKGIEVFIGPLLGVFDTQVATEAQLAADATRIFEYEQIGGPLEKFVTDSSTPVGARVNAIRALKPRLDKRATIKLIELLEDPDRRVSSEAAAALESLGIEPGATKEARQSTIKQIRAQTPEVFLENRVLSSEQQIRQITDDRDRLIDELLQVLGSTYRALPDYKAKGKFLAEHLASTRAPVKLWALEEAFQWWNGTTPDFPSEQLEPILIASISDPHRDVRLRIAEVLVSMVMSKAAQPLLTQLEAEQDDQVRNELFVALGRACSSTTSPGTAVEITPEIKAIRTQALKWAEKFLSDGNDTRRIQIGAQVTERLLKRDGLEDAEEKKYLDLLLNRYKQLKGNPGGTLAGGLLGAMAGLCEKTSASRDQAISLYRPLFVEALGDGSDSVRENAVVGLDNIDKTAALAMFWEKGLFNDASPRVRLKIIDMASEVLVPRDLPWLAEKIGVKSESDPAWKAMMGIFNSSGADVLNKWVWLAAEAGKTKLINEQKILFLEIAESKAEGEKKADMLKTVRIRLAEIHSKMSQFDKAAEYWKKVQEAAGTTQQEKDAAVVKRLDAYLSGSKPELAAQLVAEMLAKQDLDRESPLLKSIEEHLAKPGNGLDPNDVMSKLTAIEAPKERPKWGQWLKEWQLRLSKEDESADKPKPPTG
ncbi:MAG: HEAT repeat domain-containing protein [Planctomycetota bacterium]|jgi:HEAT repeat protein